MCSSSRKYQPDANCTAVCNASQNLEEGYSSLHHTIQLFIKNFYYMACVCNNKVCSDGLILGNYSPVMPTGQWWACQNKVENRAINNLITSDFQSLRENLKPWPCHIDYVNYCLVNTEMSWFEIFLFKTERRTLISS